MTLMDAQTRAEDAADLGGIIEFSLDGGHTWHHGRSVYAWVMKPAHRDTLKMQRQFVRDDAHQEHGDVDRIITRVLAEDDPRAEINRPRH